MIQPRSAYDPASVLSIGGSRRRGTTQTPNASGTLSLDPVRGRSQTHDPASSRMPSAINHGYWAGVMDEEIVATQL